MLWLGGRCARESCDCCIALRFYRLFFQQGGGVSRGIMSTPLEDLSKEANLPTVDTGDDGAPNISLNALPDLPTMPDVGVSPETPTIPDVSVSPATPILPDVSVSPATATPGASVLDNTAATAPMLSLSMSRSVHPRDPSSESGDAASDEGSALRLNHPQGGTEDPNNRRWWKLWQKASLQADYETADYIQSRNITALLLVRDVLLIIVTIVVSLVCLIVIHTSTLWLRYPAQYKWYTSMDFTKNFVGASGYPDMKKMADPSFRDLTLNHSYPALVPYLSLIGVRQYPPAMTIFLLWFMEFSGGNMDQRCMVGAGAKQAGTWLNHTASVPWPTDEYGGQGSAWAALFSDLWKYWSQSSNDPLGPTNPFFWLFPTKNDFCGSVLVHAWIDGHADLGNTSLELGQIVQHGLVAWSRDKAEAGWDENQMVRALFASTGVTVGLSVDCSGLINVANIQEGTEAVLGVGGGVMMGVMLAEAASGPIGWVAAAFTGVAMAVLSLWGALGGGDEARKQAQENCKKQFNQIVSYGAYNNCVMFSPYTGTQAQQICESEQDVWTEWAKRLVPPPKDAS